MTTRFSVCLLICCSIFSPVQAATPTDEVLYKIGEHIGTLNTWKSMPGIVLDYCVKNHSASVNDAGVVNEQWKTKNELAIQDANRQIDRYAVLFSRLEKLALQTKKNDGEQKRGHDPQAIKESWFKNSEKIVEQELFVGRTPDQLSQMCSKYQTITTMMSSENVQKQVVQATKELDEIFVSLPKEWKD